MPRLPGFFDLDWYEDENHIRAVEYVVVGIEHINKPATIFHMGLRLTKPVSMPSNQNEIMDIYFGEISSWGLGWSMNMNSKNNFRGRSEIKSLVELLYDIVPSKVIKIEIKIMSNRPDYVYIRLVADQFKVRTATKLMVDMCRKLKRGMADLRKSN